MPHCLLATPNLPEAAKLAAMDVTDVGSMEKAAAIISALGVKNVLIKGGHLHGDPVDLLWAEGKMFHLPAVRVETPHTHGSGCVYSAAITARLARGDDIVTAVKGAKRIITAAIQTSPGLGRGYGPVNMYVKADA
jgi:hydroxymethylpyrimidine kinase/phosphomethylpyrimidine kinase